ncbi:MAG: hypothetical protein WBP34_08565, partial [Thermoanaerobaculia bacterium]
MVALMEGTEPKVVANA